MHLERIMFVAVVAALAAGLIGGTLWTLVFGTRLLYRIHRRHPQLWSEFNFQFTARGPYSPAFAKWLRSRRFEDLDDRTTISVARRLLDARPVLAFMCLAGLISVVLLLQ